MVAGAVAAATNNRPTAKVGVDWWIGRLGDWWTGGLGGLGGLAIVARYLSLAIGMVEGSSGDVMECYVMLMRYPLM